MNVKAFLAALIFIVAPLVSATAPIMNLSWIVPTYPTTESNFHAYCMANDTDGGPVEYYYHWYKNGVLNRTGSTMNYSYVETADEYNCYSQWGIAFYSCGLGHDANDTTYAENPDVGTYKIIYSNISVTNQTVPVLFQILDYNSATDEDPGFKTNVSIPSSCSDYHGDKIELRFNISDKNNGNTAIFYDCNNGSHWVNIRTATGSIYSDRLYEDGYWLNPAYDSGVLQKISSIPYTDTKKHDNWTLSCLAYDGTTNSSWLNSSTITIQNTPPDVDFIYIDPPAPETTDNLTISYVYSDADGDPETNVSVIWYREGVRVTALDNSTTVNSGNLTIGEDWYFKILVFDGENWSSTHFDPAYYYPSAIATIGDNVSPTIHSDRLSGTSGLNDAPFVVYVNITETNDLAEAIMQVTTPNDQKENYSLILLGSSGAEYQYGKSYTPSTFGTYSFKFYARDGSSNKATLSSTKYYTNSPYIPSGGGGGISVVEQTKKACLIDVSPKTIFFTQQRLLQEVVLSNNDDSSYAPSFNLLLGSGNIVQYLDITNFVSTILPGRRSSFGIKYDSGETISEGTATLVLSSDNCADINLTISVVSGGAQAISVFQELFTGKLSLGELITEPIFSEDSSLRQKISFLTIGVAAIIIFAALTLSLGSLIMDSVKKEAYMITLLWAVFLAGATPILTVFVVTGIRTIF